ncbi:MAG: phosphonopyruvate decarboxylase [Proteobacteria bacterium]|nr:phosphonopyruvate decarboxylase [Pseudomonadota bacterium]
MIPADSFLEPARARGFDFFTGVPCSFLTPIINRVIGEPGLRYVGATSEGEAVAIAAGAWLAGRKTVVMCQNSGLGNMVNPLTSLNYPFRIPTLLIVTWRGQPGLVDEPQHELMGRICSDLLEEMLIPHALFPKSEGEVGPALDEAERLLAESSLPFAFIMEKGAVRNDGLDQPQAPPREAGRREDLRRRESPPSRAETLERFLGIVPEPAAVIATTGKCGRELFTLQDRAQHLYQVGSMGGASAMGLGVALNTRRPVVVLDGDGAALMKMGNMATIGAERPANLSHLLLDNGVHDSTGGQHTNAANVDFAALALACGYAYAGSADDLGGFEEAVLQALATDGPALVHMRIRPGSITGLGRPTVKPDAVARRFRAFLQDDERTRQAS